MPSLIRPRTALDRGSVPARATRRCGKEAGANTAGVDDLPVLVDAVAEGNIGTK